MVILFREKEGLQEVRLLSPHLQVLIRAHVRERPVRVLLSVVGVALGVLASTAIGTANVEVLRSFERSVAAVAGPAALEIVGHDLGIDEKEITRIRRSGGVVAASPLVEESVVVLSGDHRGEVLQVFGLDLLSEAGGGRLQVDEDSREQVIDDLMAPDTVYVGRSLAHAWNLQVGSILEAGAGTQNLRLRVAGLIHGKEGRESLWDRVAVMDIAVAQLAFDSIGRIDRIDLVVEPDHPIDDVAATIRSTLPPHLIVQRPSQRTAQVENMIRSFQLNLTVLSWVGLLVGTFLIYNTMAFAVTQRRKEIGIYRALGMTQRRVSMLFIIEGGLLGLLGGMLGGIGGVWLSQTLISLVSRTITDLYVPLESVTTTQWLDVRSLLTVINGMGFGAVVAMLGALAPSIEAGRTVAARALAPGDYEQTQQLRSRMFVAVGLILFVLSGLCSFMGPVGGLPLFGYLATLCLLAAFASFSPLCIQALGRRTALRDGASTNGDVKLRVIATEHAARHPGRNAVTVSALMVGLAIMIGVVVMVRSFRETVEVWVNETVMADLIVAPPSWLQGKQIGHASRALPISWLPVLSGLEGVDAVDTYRDVQVMAQGQSAMLVSRDLRLHARRSRYLLLQGDSSAALNRAAETGGVLVSEVLANRLRLKTGENITITTPRGPKIVPIEGVFYDYATDGGKMVMDRSLYRQLWEDDLVTVFAVYLASDAAGESVRRTIVRTFADMKGAVAPPIVIKNKELRQEILEIFDRTFLLTYVLELIAVLVAVLGIVNTLVTSVLERRRELATLQAIGASTKQVERLVLWEAVYLGLIGAGLGVGGGLAMAWILIAVINKQSFGWTIHMTVPVGLLVQAVTLAVSAAWIAGYFPARWAARQSLVDGLRDE
ncbi:putative ABC transporter, permease component [Nitrospira sp. KM1]|uniref:FtsX-like permease family protein n=1 Tax=Nitrospira sp. KM1 TaxID=1936990 RepID=UPI0013A73EEE|nr:ABC transporter permease [Nitrospira sp. KM1]BCA56220.1 putative ABC transporter, permease component [Nitrospira sp. KM1]